MAAQIVLHNGMADTWDAALVSGDWSVTPGAGVHFAIGATILLVMGLRWALRQDATPMAPKGPVWSQKAAAAGHLGFYAVLVLLPVSGVLAWGSQSAMLGQVHEVLRALLILLILAHVGAVLIHGLIWKVGVMRRMWPPL